MAIILKGSPSESINTSHKLQPKQPGVELLDNGYSRLKIGSTTNLSNLDDSSGWIEWSNLPYATPNSQIYTDTKIDFVTSGLSGTIPEEQLILCGAGYHEMFGMSVGLHGGNSLVRVGYDGTNRVELSADGTNWVNIGPNTLYPTSSMMTLGSDDNAWYGIYTTTLNVQQLKGMGTNPVILTTTLLQPAFFGGSSLGDNGHPFENGFFQNVNLVTNNSEGMSITYNSSEECLEFLVV